MNLIKTYKIRILKNFESIAPSVFILFFDKVSYEKFIQDNLI